MGKNIILASKINIEYYNGYETMTLIFRICRKCNQVLTLDYFYIGHTLTICKKCRIKQSRAYNKANSKKINAYNKANSKKINAYKKQYVIDNTQLIQEYRKQYWKANKKAIMAQRSSNKGYHKEYYIKNKEHILKVQRERYTSKKLKEENVC